MKAPIVSYGPFLDAAARNAAIIAAYHDALRAAPAELPPRWWASRLAYIDYQVWKYAASGMHACLEHGLPGPDDTGGHCRRVARLAAAITGRLTAPPGEHREQKARQNIAYLAGLLHDVGKLRTVLLSYTPGRLTDEERKLMQGHTRAGFCICAAAEMPAEICAAALQHHERLDGSGYPDGLRGDSIQPLARVVAVADVFDALTSDRVYRRGMQPAAAFEQMQNESGHDQAALAALKIVVRSGGVRR